MGNVSCDELISVTAFGKYILNPMNEVTISSSSNDILHKYWRLWLCCCWGRIQKTTLIPILTTLKKTRQDWMLLTYTVIKNWTLIKLTEKRYSKLTKNKRKIYWCIWSIIKRWPNILNEWNDKNNNLTTTIAYTYFSDRVNAIGTSNRGDLVDKAFFLRFYCKI
jgi:hypothetical protein